MRILVLGGTVFLGRHTVAAALARRHSVTIFNRGKTNPELFPDVEQLRGNRDGDLAALQGRRWDAVIDTSGYVPRIVRASAELLRGNVGHYTFVSSISSYGSAIPPGATEDTPVETLPEVDAQEFRMERYGALKAMCEQIVRETFPERSVIARAGLLVGPSDPTGRFTHWTTRIAEGGEVLAPGNPNRQVQFIDARDTADWMLFMAETGGSGTFNVTGPAARLSMRELLENARDALGSAARFTWVTDAFLIEHGVHPWTELPLWLPENENGMLSVDIRRVLATGIRFRTLASTVADTLSWVENERRGEDRPDGAPEPPRPAVGLGRRREHELLAAWGAGAT